MAINIVANLEANTKEAVRQVDKVNEKVKEVSKNAKKAGDDLTEGMVIGNAAVKQVDKVTSGLASSLVKVAKAAKLSGKAMRVALLSTGIGAITIAVGLLVEYWDEITDLINGSNKELEKQIVLNNQNLDAVDRKLRNTRTQIELEKKQGKNVDALIEKEKALIEEKRKTMLAQIELEKSNLRNLQTEAETLTTMEFIRQGKKGISEITEEENEALLKQKEILSNIENAYTQFESSLIEEKTKPKDTGATDAEKLAEQQRLKAIDDKASSIEEITKLEDDFLQSQLDKQTQEENAVYDKYFAQIQAAEDYGLDTTVLEEARQKELQVISDKYTEEAKDKEKKRLEDIQKIVNDATELSDLEKLENERLAAQEELKLLDATWIEKARINAFYMQQIADKEKEISDEKLDNDTKIADAKTDLQNKLVGNVQNAVGAIGNIFEKGTAASKGAALAEIAIGTGIGFINALDIAQKSAKGTGPAAAFAFPIFYASQIAAVLGAVSQAKNILSTVKGGGGSGSTPTAPSGGGSAPQPPAFNIVGASGETQLADAIGSQTQRPSRAYVVSNDVTTAQEMDRNIIEGASIG